MKLLDSAKSELLRANADRRHPFRTFYLATLGKFPEVRTVVKRQSLPDLTTIFYTDSRSPKCLQIKQQSHVSALFYHPRKKLQIRIRGEAILIDAQHPEHASFVQKISQSPSLKDYTTLKPPGSSLTKQEAVFHGKDIFFTVVRIKPLEIDILQLGDPKHERALYSPTDTGWSEQALVP